MSVSIDDVRDAAARIAPHARRTPLVRADHLSKSAGRDVYLKLETLQRTHAFKYRGACNALLSLRSPSGAIPPLVTASAGNHGLAMATAARDLGALLTVYLPSDASRVKLQRLQDTGVTIVADARNYDEAEARALEHARAHDAVFVSPYNHPAIVAGAGTIGLEILEDLPSPGAVVVPTGGGGLISGVALGCGARTTVVGVEPAESPAFQTALAAGAITPIVPGTSIADGLVGNIQAGSITFDIVQALHIRVRTVDEALVVRGVRELFLQEHIVAEGSGAIGVGALLDGGLDDIADPLVIVITGANMDPRLLVRILALDD